MARCELIAVLLVAASTIGWAGGMMSGCTAVQTVDKEQPRRTFLRVRVQPPDAGVYINGRFRGRADGWTERMIPVEAGDLRVKLEADGYITQRFDVSVRKGHTHTLKVTMEPTLDSFDE